MNVGTKIAKYRIIEEMGPGMDYSLVSARPEIAGVIPILKKALEKDLANRYQTAIAMAEDIRRVIGEVTGPVN